MATYDGTYGGSFDNAFLINWQGWMWTPTFLTPSDTIIIGSSKGAASAISSNVDVHQRPAL